MSAIDSIGALRYAEKGAELANVDDKIAEFESLFSVVLPEDYKVFLRWSGRTMLLKQNFLIPESPPTFRGVRTRPVINWLYGLNDYKENLFSMNETYQGRIPNGLITIGSSGADDQICMSVSKNTPAGVFYWFHEMEVDTDNNKVPDFANMFLLARNFSQFAEKLTPDEETPSKARVKKVSLRF